MVRYVQLAREQIPIGTSALLLFLKDGRLCAGVIAHRCDGRFERRIPDRPHPDHVVPIIGQLMAGAGAIRLNVVLESGAYWPEQFPILQI